MMEIEFDKEMDAILRQARKGEPASSEASTESRISNSASPHLDADEISAFAENALPEKAKRKYTIHIADCNVCRKTLSDLILLNAEPVIENIYVEKIAVISSTPPWYRRIFAFPNLAYTMGGLVVIFSGIIAFTLVQSFSNPQVSEISQINEKTQTGSEIISENKSPQAEPGLSKSANTNTSTAYAPNTAATVSPDKTVRNSNAGIVAAKPVGSPGIILSDEPRPANSSPADSKKDENFSIAGEEQSNKRTDSPAAAPLPVERRAEKEKPAASDKGSDSDRKAQAEGSVSRPQISELPVNGRRTADLQLSSPAKKAKTAETLNRETTSVGGKIFNRRNNVWYDAAYNEQPTVNLTRGTKEYKKLDKNLRLTVENLGGTVVILWKNTAYRIR